MAKEDGDNSKKMRRPVEQVDWANLHVAILVEWTGPGPYHYELLEHVVYLLAGKGTPESYAGYFCMQPVDVLPVKGMRVHSDSNVIKAYGNARVDGMKGFYSQTQTITRKGLHPSYAQARAFKALNQAVATLRQTLPGLKRISVN